MVDVNKRKGGGEKKKKKKSSSSKKKKKKSSSSSTSSSGSTPEPFSMEDDYTANFEDAQLSQTSERWASEGSELNYHAQGGESERAYVKRQIEECTEFYENYVERAEDNMIDINQFTLIHHALLLSMARNRSGIMDVLVSNYGYSEEEALSQTEKICQKAGEGECYNKLTRYMTRNIREDD